MKRIWLAGLVAIVCFSASGCPATYTHIDKATDGSYTVTKTTQGFWRASGELYRCEARAATMTCSKLGGD